MKALFFTLTIVCLALVLLLSGCDNIQTNARRAIDMGRIDDDVRVTPLSDLQGNVAYAATEHNATERAATDHAATERVRISQTVPAETQQLTSTEAQPPVPDESPTEPISLAKFSTSIVDYDSARKINIKKSSDAINGTVVKPDEVFSFNDSVGPTEKETGFLPARIFIKGKDAKGYGGGVCQVSSTLFQAAEKAGLEIVERHPHSKDVSYAEEGEDAATSYGGIDLKIKNNNNSDITILSQVEDEQVTVEIKIS